MNVFVNDFERAQVYRHVFFDSEAGRRVLRDMLQNLFVLTDPETVVGNPVKTALHFYGMSLLETMKITAPQNEAALIAKLAELPMKGPGNEIDDS